MNNNSTIKWVAIITSIIIAAGSISFGVIQGSAKERIDDCQNRLDSHEEMITELKTQGAVIENELKHLNSKIEELKILIERMD
jgi:peptidoglycan hydrolase CwlO-like protein